MTSDRVSGEIGLHAALEDRELRQHWSAAIDPASNLYCMYAAPDWLDHLPESDKKASRVQCLAGAGPACVVAVLRPISTALRFELSHVLRMRVPLRAMELLGSQLVGQATPELLRATTASIWKSHPRIGAIYLKSVVKGSALWRALEQSDWTIDGATAYRPHGDRPFHFATLPATFDEYESMFSAKRRYNLRRNVRKMAEAHGGQLEVRQASRAEDIGFLVQSAKDVLEGSWKARRLANPVPDSMQDIDQLGRLARAGMIRAFVLLANGSPCAFIIGYLYRGVFHYADLAYRESHAAHSPGTVLLYLAIKELIEQDHPQYINFGVTDNQFKQVFADQHTEDAEVLVLRPGTASWLLRTAHSSFQKAKHRVRARLARPNAAKQPDAAA